MYKMGWNMIWYAESSSSFFFTSYPHYAGPALAESASDTDYTDLNSFGINFGGYFNSGSGFTDSLQGVLHSVFIRKQTMNSAAIESNWLVPRTTPYYIWDYFIGMFTNFGSQLVGNTFNNQMYDYAGQSQMLTNSIAATVDPTNGLSFSSTQTQSIQGVKVTTQRAIGVQFWFKGSFSNNQRLVSIAKSSTVFNAYFDRNANDIRLKTSHGSNTVVFSTASSSLSSSTWAFFVLNVGWIAKSNDFRMCGYIYQAGAYEFGDCSTTFTIAPADMGNGDTLYIEFGPGLTGSLKEAYTINHLSHPHVFGYYKTLMGTQRYNCFASNFHQEPHIINNGCGNGYIVAGDTGETWDDLNISNGDGCSSSCQVEGSYSWSSTGVAGISKWEILWGNGVVDSGEAWDDGNKNNLDGCNSSWIKENGWTWTDTLGAISVCTSIWGDNYRVAGEAWDDGNNLDGQGCKSDCSGELDGWHWSGGSATAKDTWTEQCGDGYVTPGEQWEDGNTFNLDGCSSSCQIEPGWNWVGTVGLNPTTCTSICGDNYRVAGEAWDDGDNTDNQGCEADCSGELPGWHCTGGSATTKDTCIGNCGDGYVTPGEQWEDGNTFNLDGCSSSCQIEPGWNWVGTVGLNPTTCTSICGDNYRVAGEAWDDGNNSDGLGCKADCSGELDGWHCTGGSATSKDTCTELWGDGYVTPSEQCEDGNTNSLDGWSSSCLIEPGWNWVGTVGLNPTTCTSIWGDNYRVQGENCDDGDITDGEGCKADCSAELPGWHCTGGSATSNDVCTELCGDGYLTPNEQWEDGNTNDFDGCNSLCQLEPGWNWVTGSGLNPSLCTPIWGDNFRVTGEAWDDGNSSDNQGCLSDWSGEINGWHWSGGDHTQPDTWFEQWGDGHITISEQCENGPASNGDGCDSNWQIEPGWTCINNPTMTFSLWSNCGDGIISGLETCDDGDKNDNKGWNDRCDGEIRGWYCSANPSAPPAHVCTTQLMDGIRVSPEEECDDGNSNNADGCANSGIIMPKWTWTDDMLQKSIWVQMWGNGIQDHVDEEWDDGNNDVNDGCTDWIIDQGWQWQNGSPTVTDVWYRNPIASIKSVSIENRITIEFSEPMQNISLDSSLSLTISGPYSPYKFSYTSSFSNDTELIINVAMKSQMKGDGQDIFTIEFDTIVFLSQNNANLSTRTLSAALYKIPMVSEAIGSVGTGINSFMGVTFAALIASNILLGQSTELMWGFMNTMQIIYFFPLLMLYYPDNLSTILTYFSSWKLMIDLPFIDVYKTQVKNKIEIAEKVGMTSVNERYESLEYYSTSILLNGEDIFYLVLQSFVICIIIFSLRAIFFTLQWNISVYEEELEMLEKGIKLTNPKKEATLKSKSHKFNRWFKKKIQETSQEYKFNFILRIFLQLYLETAVLSFLNLRFMENGNFWQVLSTITSLCAVVFLLIFFGWSILFSCKNFKNFREKERVDVREVESMFGQYKTKNLPQALFNSFFMLRRLLYVCIIIFLPSAPILQAFCFWVICLPILAYHLVMNPYLLTVNNVMMNINELNLVMWGAFFFVFAEPKKDQKALEAMGWVVVGIIVTTIIANVVLLWTLKIIMIVKEIKQFLANFKKEKKSQSFAKADLYHVDSVRSKAYLINLVDTISRLRDDSNSQVVKQMMQNRQLQSSRLIKINTQIKGADFPHT
jgi:cysteine-rich repeat protein